MGEPLNNLPSVQQLLRSYRITANKRLGQHFLFDRFVTDHIVTSVGCLNNASVIEVGPGPGMLTRSLLASNAAHIYAIEKDTRFVELLTKELVPASAGRLTIIEADALRTPITSFLPEGQKAHIVANLPYNVGTELLLQWLNQLDVIASMTLMFQKEVAKRITSEPGNKSYGRLSVKSQFLCETSDICDVPAQAFSPPPKVDSAVVQLVPRSQPISDVSVEALETLCKAVFAQRRKTLRVSLKTLVNHPKVLLAEAGIDDNLRPEQLDITQLSALAKRLAHHSTEDYDL